MLTKASRAEMSHVSMCFCTRPFLITYCVDPVYGLILGLPGKFSAASNRHLVVMVCGSVTCHSQQSVAKQEHSIIRAEDVAPGELCVHHIKRHYGMSEHDRIDRHKSAPFSGATCPLHTE